MKSGASNTPSLVNFQSQSQTINKDIRLTIKNVKIEGNSFKSATSKGLSSVFKLNAKGKVQVTDFKSSNNEND